MSGKRVPIGLKPGVQKRADDWVTDLPSSASVDASNSVVPMKRLTIDIPEDLHHTFKVKATTEGVKMADLVRSWIKEWCAS
jgi:hypothetical protein